jgi:hypothetical protein
MRKAIVLLLLIGAAPVLADTMYARFTAPVRSGQGLAAGTIGTLRQGDAVQALGREGRYYRVSYRGQTGYVYYNKLADRKPEDVAALLSRAPGGAPIELTELEAGGALRGLSPMAESYVGASDVPEWAVQAVEAMQSRSVSLEELEAFQREGGLAEYGGEAAR